MSERPEIVFTFPGCMGGVASFNFNIINNSRTIRNFYSKVVLLKAKEDDRPAFHDHFIADEVVEFSYSNKENQYYVQKRLSAVLGDKVGAIVTDNALTITTAARFDSPKTVFHLLHDYFYVNQQVQMGDMVDVAIAHSSFFSDAVFASNPALFFNRSLYIPYGVYVPEYLPKKRNEVLKLVFLGRLDDGKGVMLLHEIEQILQKKGVHVSWTIIGKGPLRMELDQQWKDASNVRFHEPDTTSEVYGILAAQDIFIFPTSFEGTPVSILECLANGVVTITNDLPGGIRDIVKENIGHRCAMNDTGEYAAYIQYYDTNRDELKAVQENCFALAKAEYDIATNADRYFERFLQYAHYKRSRKKKHLPTSRLDKAMYPNKLVQLFRNLR